MSARAGKIGRAGLCWLLVLAWLIAVWHMWQAVASVAGAESPVDAAPGTLPTPRTFVAAVAFSGIELGIILALVWPRWPVLYATRLASGILALVTWSIMIAPPALGGIDTVHHRWLTAMAVMLLVALLVVLLYRAAAWARRKRSTPGRAAAG